MKWVGENSVLVMVALALLAILASLLAATSFVKATNAQDRVTALEIQKRTNDTSRVATCYPSARSRDVVVGGLSGLALSMSVTISATAVALAQDPTGPLAATRRRNLQKLIPAKAKLERLILLYAANVPTLASCDALARELGINPRPFRKAPAPGQSGGPG